MCNQSYTLKLMNIKKLKINTFTFKSENFFYNVTENNNLQRNKKQKIYVGTYILKVTTRTFLS